ncbi:MAG: tetratricopeptide repeat protein [Bacteroidales bacterium]|nr:tetratricopeptide repeat protein [Bacteroidales bacterium]
MLKAQEAIDVSSLLKTGAEELYRNPAISAKNAEVVLRHYGLVSGKNDNMAEAKLLLAKSQKLVGNYDNSISNLYDALDYCQEKSYRLQGKIELEIGFLYSRMFDYKKAVTYCNQGTSLLKAWGDSLDLADCYNTLGVVHCNAEEYLEAERYFKMALNINRKLGQEHALAANLNNLCLFKGDLEEKLGYIDEAIGINTFHNRVWSLGENFNNKGRQYYYANCHKEALEQLSLARKYAETVGSKELLCDNYEYHAMVYCALGDYKQAYECQKQLESLRSELQSAEKLRNIEENIMQKRLEQKAHEEKIREQEYRIESLRQRSMLLLCVIIILVVAVALWINVQKRRMNKHDVTTLSVFIKSRNELLEKIRERIKEGQKMDEAELRAHLKRVNLFIRQNQDIVKTNSTISSKITDSNTEFIDTLKRLHPNLTPGEVNLASMLRINLSTKEIAQLTDTQPKTVNMNRYRLRKALHLPQEADLVEYLKKL